MLRVWGKVTGFGFQVFLGLVGVELSGRRQGFSEYGVKGLGLGLGLGDTCLGLTSLEIRVLRVEGLGIGL